MGLSHVWIFLGLFVSLVFAAPKDNAKGNVTITTYGSATFASEPHGRGTVGILISCTATFIFCIWTAVHPNIVPGVKTRERYYFKTILMLFSIIVPEGVLVCAIGQFREAWRVRKAWRKCPNIDENFKEQVNLEVAFFVVMGGFVVDLEDDPTEGSKRVSKSRRFKNVMRHLTCRETKAQSPWGPYRAILTPTGFKYYLREGLIHEKTFDKASIIDKGKASTFAKCLAGIQALWLVVECAARWQSRLPLTLVEVHVLIHVVRTALIYAFWWWKPLDVNEPIRIKLRKSRIGKDKSSSKANGNELVSKFSSGTILSQDPVNPTPTISPANEISEPDLIRPDHGPGHPAKQPTISSVQSVEAISVVGNTPSSPSEEPVVRPLAGDDLQREIDKSKKYSPNEPHFITKQSPHSLTGFHCQAIYDIIIQIDVGEREGRQGIDETSPNIAPNISIRQAASSNSGEEEGREQKEKQEQREKSFRFSFALFGEALLICLTGALHAAAWNSRFPTAIEKWLWRGSSLAMCCCCLGLFLIANFTEYEQDLIASVWKFGLSSYGFREFFKEIWKEIDTVCKRHAKGTRNTRYYLHQIGVWTACFFVIVYFFSVLYITVESYLSLRDPPENTFLTVSWTDYWPHL